MKRSKQTIREMRRKENGSVERSKEERGGGWEEGVNRSEQHNVRRNERKEVRKMGLTE